jgi:hypothetical protein
VSEVGRSSHIGPPGLAAGEVEDVWVVPEEEDVFSRNFLLMFIALKRFGCAVELPEALEPDML